MAGQTGQTDLEPRELIMKHRDEATGIDSRTRPPRLVIEPKEYRRWASLVYA